MLKFFVFFLTLSRATAHNTTYFRGRRLQTDRHNPSFEDGSPVTRMPLFCTDATSLMFTTGSGQHQAVTAEPNYGDPFFLPTNWLGSVPDGIEVSQHLLDGRYAEINHCSCTSKCAKKVAAPAAGEPAAEGFVDHTTQQLDTS